jgi:pimeloyl-ACP methyl ester carboxylesterase
VRPLVAARYRIASSSRDAGGASLAVDGRHVELPGRGRLYVREAVGPPQAPTVVLLHGLGATASLNWDACLPTLARRFHVVAPDHRGHGHGIRCGAHFRLEDCADDVAALIHQEALAPALLAGYSMGGPIAQLLCRRHSELVTGLILCATSRDFRGRPLERAQFGVLGLAALAARLAPAIAISQPRGGRAHRPGDLFSEVSGHERRAIVAAAASLGSFTSRDWIGDLTTPAVVIVTNNDRIVPVRRQQKLAVSLGAPVLELDAGHFAARSHPLALAHAISEAAARLVPVPQDRAA